MEAINETPPKQKAKAKPKAKAIKELTQDGEHEPQKAKAKPKAKAIKELTQDGEHEPQKAKAKPKTKAKAINDLPTKTRSEILRDHINKKTFKEAERVFNNAIKQLQK